MKKRIASCYLLLLLVLLPLIRLWAQPLPVNFENYSIGQGLSSSTVYGVLRDSYGFLWLATEDGLNRFDGTNFVVYHHHPTIANSLRVNQITSLYESRDGCLWVGTNGGGLNYYDRTKDSVLFFDAPISTAITSISGDAAGRVLVTAYGGLTVIDPKTKKLLPNSLYQPLQKAINGKICSSVLEDRQKRVWVGTDVGLYCYEPAANKLRYYTHRANEPTSLPDNVVMKLTEDGSGNIWIGTLGGLAKMAPGALGFVNYRQSGTSPSISSNVIYALAADSKNQLWIGTDEGLDVLNIASNTLTSYTPDIRLPRSISSRSIRSILIDKQGIYWVGTFRGGLNKYDENGNYFNLKTFNAFDPYGLRSPIVTSFADNGPDVYIGTDGGGLQLFHRQTGLLDYIPLPITFSTNKHDLTILTMEMDHMGRLWIGTYLNGVYCLGPGGRLLKHYLKGDGPNDLNSNDIFCLKEDSQGNMWVGTNGGGVNVISAGAAPIRKYLRNPSNPNDNTFPGNNFIRSLQEDRAGNIWIGTLGAGLSVFNPLTQTFSLYDKSNSHLPSDYVVSSFIDRAGNVWAGTNGNGLGLLKPGSRQFEQITEKNGLRSGMVNAIVADDAGKIWLGTGAGLYSLTPGKGWLKSYSTRNGLQSGTFVPGAALKLPDGQLFFGGENGFNYFYPTLLRTNNNVPPVVFTSLTVDNQPVAPGPNAPIQQAMPLAREIRLRWKQSFSIAFEALNFTDPESNQYEYQLIDIDKDWVRAGKDHSAAYADIAPGTYIFRVRASNNDGTWNQEGHSVKVIVVPPFWRTVYAYLFYVLVLLAGLWLLRRRGIRKIQARFDLQQERQKAALLLEQERQKATLLVEQERREAENQRQMNDMKIKFLTNLSHEFRTPVSLIVGPADDLTPYIKEEKPQNQLNLIRRNARRLLNLVNQLLDFRKMEEQELKLQVADGELVSFVKEVSDSFKDLSEKKNIGFAFSSSFDELHTRFDHDKLERILFNLLSNAFKFTLSGGTVSLMLRQTEPDGPPAAQSTALVTLRVMDTGIGIPAAQQSKIFERFFQHATDGAVLNQGTGIGLSITKEFVEMHGGTITFSSEPDRGTTFCVHLPLPVLPPPATATPEETATANERVADEATMELLPASVPGTVTQSEGSQAEKSAILLVEDNEDLRFYLKENLKLQYKVLEAANGKEGWQKALAQHPQLIVSDISMPYMDGIELCKKIKADKRTSHIPVILLTALAAEHDLMKGLDTGANDYITKPFNFEVLSAKVKNLLTLNNTLKSTYTRQIKVLAPEVKVESEDEKLMERIMTYLEENLTNSQLSVEELSRQVGMSRSSLYSKLLELSGQTPVEFIRSVKLDKAAVLLEKSDMTIAQIAYSVGFSTPNYFAKSFKTKYGMLPSEYVQQKKKTGKASDDEER